MTKTTDDQSIQTYFIRTTLLVSDHSIYHPVYTDMKCAGQCNSYYNVSIYSWDWNVVLCDGSSDRKHEVWFR